MCKRGRTLDGNQNGHYPLSVLPMNCVTSACHALGPSEWTKDDVKEWLEWCENTYALTNIPYRRFEMNGKALCLLKKEDFCDRLPDTGDVLYNALQDIINLRERVPTCSAVNNTPRSPVTTPTSWKSTSPTIAYWPSVDPEPSRLAPSPQLNPLQRVTYPSPPPAHTGLPCTNYLPSPPPAHLPTYHQLPYSPVTGNILCLDCNNNHTDLGVCSGRNLTYKQVAGISPFYNPHVDSTNQASPHLSSGSLSPAFMESRGEDSLTIPFKKRRTAPIPDHVTSGASFDLIETDESKETFSYDGDSTYQNDQSSSESGAPSDSHPSSPSADGRLLWEFIRDLLDDVHQYGGVVRWECREKLEFKIVNPTGLAQLWGQHKHKVNMNYEKLARALRYYYSTNIIGKVQGRRLTYKYLKEPDAIQKGQRGAKPGVPHKSRRNQATVEKEVAINPSDLINDVISSRSPQSRCNHVVKDEPDPEERKIIIKQESPAIIDNL